ALELCQALVRESAADETEVTFEHGVEQFARYAASGVTQSADRERYELAVRVRLAGPGGLREARASVAGCTLAEGRRALQRALELASFAPPHPELVPLGGPVRVRDTRVHSATLQHAFEDKARLVAEAQGGGERGFEPAGLIQTSALAKAIVNSRGRAVYGQTGRFASNLTVTGEGGAGTAQASSARPNRALCDSVVRTAWKKAMQSRDPRSIAPGEYTVVLEPLAVSSILLFAAYQGFGAREVEEQSSFLCGREGKPIWPESLTITDDPENPLMPALAFDGEGTPKQRVVLVDRGRPCAPVTDRHFAARRGVESSGHAQAQPSGAGPAPQNMVVQPGNESLAELVAGVERGLLVSQFHYTNAIDSKELLLTGMTRNGTFWIEDGRIRHPVKNLRFTESLVEALAGLTGVGKRVGVAGALFDGEIVTPPIRLARFRFTSATDF
ncbi:MAG TPA: metallopeptidase TldD-related protein, partial [Planctomycetota bacterium]|nr:metallopeptidase TldD-related protein [Planctomycetota bacterium]